jgi:uncharacterized protein (UPF0216 family)
MYPIIQKQGAIRAKTENGNLRLMLKKLKSINSKRPKSRKSFKELIDERETEINFLENENLDYQQKRFGPNRFNHTKIPLVKPIQDQVLLLFKILLKG